MKYEEMKQEWLDSPVIAESYKEEIRKIHDETELQDRFYQELEFGTAGLRGKLGAGTNRMNRYTVGKATEGLARTIVEAGENAMKRGLVIAYDVRHQSHQFADIAAGILATHGIRVYLFPDIRPTPMLSYAVRYLNCVSGIVVTASHNPKDYNGYKVYWEEGSQILDDKADEILAHIAQVRYEDIAFLREEDEAAQALIKPVPQEVDESYYNLVLGSAVRDEELKKSVHVVYTPLNGTGNLPVRHVLKKRGFDHVTLVEEQVRPDPDFATVGYPNPEDHKAFDLAKQWGQKVDADLLLATDPDCDRVSMMCKDGHGGYRAFNGNQIGALLVHYILEGLAEKKSLPPNAAIVKSIVTGDLAKRIAKDYEVPVFETLTGFKYICSLPNAWDRSGEYQMLFGYEESIGYVYRDFVRDKDAVISSMLIVEMADYYLGQGNTLGEVLDELYQTYGYYDEKLLSITLEGAEGQALIGRIMEDIRRQPLTLVNNESVVSVVDYQVDKTGLPKSNVLKYTLADGTWFAIRPSGTEPKIKLYIYVIGENDRDAEYKLEVVEREVRARMESVR